MDNASTIMGLVQRWIKLCFPSILHWLSLKMHFPSRWEVVEFCVPQICSMVVWKVKQELRTGWMTRWFSWQKRPGSILRTNLYTDCRLMPMLLHKLQEVLALPRCVITFWVIRVKDMIFLPAWHESPSDWEMYGIIGNIMKWSYIYAIHEWKGFRTMLLSLVFVNSFERKDRYIDNVRGL